MQTHKTALKQDLPKGVHYHIFDKAEEALSGITDIKSANLVAIPVEMCADVVTVKSYVDESILIGDCVNVLDTLLAKEGL